jgi:hypothetical protein
MISNVTHENNNSTIYDLNRQFAGRIGSKNYRPQELYHIHRRNRAYVWNMNMQINFLDSILKGYYIPPIICSQSIVDGCERRDVMEGGNRITTLQRILNGEVKPLTQNGEERPLTQEETMKVNTSSIQVVVMRGLTSKQQREMFRRLNKSIKVSDGQLYAMSEEDSPLIKEALALLEDDNYPLRQMISNHFCDTRLPDNPGKKNLENAVALVSGAIHGVKYITKSYNVQEPKVESQTLIEREEVVRVLGFIFSIFDLADEMEMLKDMRKRRGQWNVGKLLGAMLYDYHTSNHGAIKHKWASYISMVRRGEHGAEDAIKLSGAQNLNTTRYKRVCVKVDIYVRDKRLATESELNNIIHIDQDGLQEESESDDESC